MSWKGATVEAAFEFVRNGKSVRQDKSGDGLPITRIETISDWRIDPNRVGFAGIHEAGNEKWLLHKGDILFSHINSVEHIGKCAVYEGTPERLIHGMNLLALRPKAGILDPKFAYYALSRSEFRKAQAPFVNKAVNQASISTTNLKSLWFPLPPLDEQRRIAAILDQADDLRRKRRGALELIGYLLTSSFLELFGDPLANSAAYPLRELKTLGRVVTGSTPPSSREGMFGGPVPFITPGDLESEEPVKRSLTHAGARESRMVDAGSALVCCIGAIGKMAIALKECAFNQQINAVEWGKEIEPHYGINVLQFFRRKIADDGASTTVPILKKSLFEKITIPTPPISLQRTFSAHVVEIDKLKAHHRAHLAKLDALFASLQHRAFRGEL